MIKIKKDFLEHLLACLANQKFINQVNADWIQDEIDWKKTINETQKSMQEAIDKAYIEWMDLLEKARNIKN